jgi:hypothetical protein
MNRFILLAFALHCSCTATATAEDYLLRLDTMGYVDRPATEQHPNETTLRSIEVATRPESAFHCKVRMGTQQTLLTGRLSSKKNGNFTLQLRYVRSIDTGVTIPTGHCRHKPLLGTTEIDTTVTISLGDPATVASFDTETERSGHPKDKSKTRYVVLLTKHEPPSDCRKQQNQRMHASGGSRVLAMDHRWPPPRDR